ncbi:nuclease-related domain-containing protein [Kyrpidia sp.]|uniref:nuclease-related domain-containing protein n=1 Tax=Kyrpidia sp. TaxID=2073077 RepID=UPI00258B0781|nr:nuclease-related domain-containing protein [Kyrpidia sp.]MCL6577064.1 NERD domain-containing protein [Kyrpidia sp.]
MILKSKKENPDRLIDRALRGAKGEERVEEILSSLPDTYRVFHDLPCPMGNIDHIAVGPAGIFVIESKSHRGKITVTPDGNLLRDGRPFEKNVVNQVWRQTMWLKETLESHLGQSVFVHPFLVFVNGFVQVYRPVQEVTVLPGKWLVETITKKPSRLTEQQVDAVRQALYALHASLQPAR